MMEIPGLGKVAKHANFDFWISEVIPVPVLNGILCQFYVTRYDNDPQQEDFHSAIANFLSLDPSALKEAEGHIFQYYTNCNDNWEPDDDEFLAILSPSDVWRHVQLGNQPWVRRRSYGDKAIYISVECNCDWEREHGLQIVFKNGLKVSKIGPYDGHLTNSDAYGDDRLEGLVYR